MRRSLAKRTVVPIAISFLMTFTSVACAINSEVQKTDDNNLKQTDKIRSKKESFTDVEKDSWYYEVVKKCHDMGLISGYEDGSFKPDSEITREDAMTILVRYLDAAKRRKPTQDIDVLNKYSDRQEISDYAEDAIDYLTKVESVRGFPDGSIKPKKNITRADSVIMTIPYAGKWILPDIYTSKFKDVLDSHYAGAQISDAVALEVVNGRTEDMFYPDENITRAEYVKLLDNIFEKYKKSVEPGLKNLLVEAFLKYDDVNNDNVIERFSKYGKLTLSSSVEFGIEKITIELNEDSPVKASELMELKKDSLAKDLNIDIIDK